MKKSVLVFITLLSMIRISAQYMFVDSGYDPIDMINDFFGNDSVIISNVQFNGNTLGMGFFDTDGAGINVHTGIVFSTGIVDQIPMANNSASTSTNLGGPSDQDIELISGGLPSFDACIVEFDFMVTDTQYTDFTYVFASEEYPEFVGSGFNDAFGFFLTGPMYLGGPYTGGAHNIAVIPNTDIPVSINSINQNMNAQYYLDMAGNPFVYFDGALDALPAAFYAIPNEVYHIKIVVADVSDGIFDSAVFLGYNSLNNPDSLVPPTNFAFSVQGYTATIINESKYASSYDWDFGDGQKSTVKFPQPVTYQEEGTYEVTLITQNFCCSDTITQSITIENTLFANAEVVKNVSCNGGGDGIISFNIGGGEEPYLVTWVPEIENLDSVKAGLYTYFVSDALDSLVSGEIVISEPEILIPEVIAYPETDDELGSLALSPVGGVSPYSILWSTGDTTMTLSGLEAGDYGLTLTDANGCVAVEEVEVPLMISLNYELIVLNNPVACFGDETTIIDLQGIGGEAPYDIIWEPEISSEGVGAGTYYFSISDASGAIIVDSLVVSEPDPLTASFDVVEANSQQGGSITVNADGGTAPYTYLWSTGDTTKTISDLAPGAYTVTITDSNACTYEFSANVTLQEQLLVNEIVSNNPLACFGDTNAIILLEIQGGSAPYSIMWEPSIDPNGVGGGTYNYLVEDSSGNTFSNSIVISEPEELVVTIDHTDTQLGEMMGSASAQVEGGVEPYSYLWNNDMKTPDLEFLSEGEYTVTVTDANGCTTAQSVIINGVVSSDKEAVDFSVFPNPAKSLVNMKLNGISLYTIEVIDLHGKEHFVDKKLKSESLLQLSVENLASGLYVVKLKQHGREPIIAKFVKI